MKKCKPNSPCCVIIWKAIVHALIAEYDGHAAGFALSFFNYSTFKSKRGLYLEGIFL